MHCVILPSSLSVLEFSEMFCHNLSGDMGGEVRRISDKWWDGRRGSKNTYFWGDVLFQWPIIRNPSPKKVNFGWSHFEKCSFLWTVIKWKLTLILLSADFDLLIQTFFFVKISEVNVPFVNVRWNTKKTELRRVKTCFKLY